jgi:hypothetical protein
MPKKLGSKPRKKNLSKNPLSFKSTHLTIIPTDLAEMASKPGDIKLNRKKIPFTPGKVFRNKKSWSLAGVKKTLPGAVKLATLEHSRGYDVGRAKTRDGYAVYISV